MEPLFCVIDAVFLIALSMYPLGLMMGSECCCGSGSGIPVDCFGDGSEPRCIVKSNGAPQHGFANFTDRYLTYRPDLDDPLRHGVMPNPAGATFKVSRRAYTDSSLSYGESVTFTATPTFRGRDYSENLDRQVTTTLSPSNPTVEVRGWDFHFYEPSDAASEFENVGFEDTADVFARSATDSSKRTSQKSKNAALNFEVVGVEILGNAAVEMSLADLVGAVSFSIDPEFNFTVTAAVPKSAFSHSQSGVIKWTVRVFNGFAYVDRKISVSVTWNGVTPQQPPLVPLLTAGVLLASSGASSYTPSPPADSYVGGSFVVYAPGEYASRYSSEKPEFALPPSVDFHPSRFGGVTWSVQRTESLIEGPMTELVTRSAEFSLFGDIEYKPSNYWVFVSHPQGYSNGAYIEKDSGKVSSYISGTGFIEGNVGSISVKQAALLPTAFCESLTVDLPYQLLPQTITATRADGSRVVQDKCGFAQDVEVVLDYMGGNSYANLDYEDFGGVTGLLSDVANSWAVLYLHGFNPDAAGPVIPPGGDSETAARTASTQPSTLSTPPADYGNDMPLFAGIAGTHPPKKVIVTVSDAKFEYYSENEMHLVASDYALRQADGPNGPFNYVEWLPTGNGFDPDSTIADCSNIAQSWKYTTGIPICGGYSSWHDGFAGLPNPGKEGFREAGLQQLKAMEGEYEFTVSGVSQVRDDGLIAYSYSNGFSPLTLELTCDLQHRVQGFSLGTGSQSFRYDTRNPPPWHPGFGTGHSYSYYSRGDSKYSQFLAGSNTLYPKQYHAGQFSHQPGAFQGTAGEYISWFSDMNNPTGTVGLAFSRIVAPVITVGINLKNQFSTVSGQTTLFQSLSCTIPSELVAANSRRNPAGPGSENVIDTVAFPGAQCVDGFGGLLLVDINDGYSLPPLVAGQTYRASFNGLPSNSILITEGKIQYGPISFDGLVATTVDEGDVALAQDYIGTFIDTGQLAVRTQKHLGGDMLRIEGTGIDGQPEETYIQPPGKVFQARGVYNWEASVEVAIRLENTQTACTQSPPIVANSGPVGDVLLPEFDTSSNCFGKSLIQNNGITTVNYTGHANQPPNVRQQQKHSFADGVYLYEKTGFPVSAASPRLGTAHVRGVGTFQYTATVQYEGNAIVNDCLVNKTNEDRLLGRSEYQYYISNSFNPDYPGYREEITGGGSVRPVAGSYNYGIFDAVAKFSSKDASHEIRGWAGNGDVVGLIVQHRQTGFSESVQVGTASGEADQTTTASGGVFSFSWSGGDAEGDYLFHVFALGKASGTTSNYEDASYGCNSGVDCLQHSDDFAGRLSVTHTAALPSEFGVKETAGGASLAGEEYLSDGRFVLSASGFHRTSSVRSYIRWFDSVTGVALSGEQLVPYTPVVNGRVQAEVSVTADLKELGLSEVSPKIECYDELGNSISGTSGETVRLTA